jgi:hypothetical protein
LQVFQYLQEHPCVDCGESDPLVLQFDHVRGKKTGTIGELIGRTSSWDKIQEEIGKCQVRCANCHARRTAIQQGWIYKRGLGFLVRESLISSTGRLDDVSNADQGVLMADKMFRGNLIKKDDTFVPQGGPLGDPSFKEPPETKPPEDKSPPPPTKEEKKD